MSLPVVVMVCALIAAGGVFAVSASRRIEVDPIDPLVEERALHRTIARHPRLARFLRERLDRRTAGGFLLTVGFGIVVGVAIVFGLLLDMIDENRGLAAADESVAEWGSLHATSTAVDILQVVTDLGSTTVVIAVLAGAAWYDFAGRRAKEVFAFAAVVGFGQLLITNVLKTIVDRDRPAVLQLVETSGHSFPSGHAAAAAAAWSAVALILGRNRPRVARALLAATAALVAVSVAVSRALLGVHWVTDVIGGLALGWGWFVLVAVVFGGRAQRLGDPVDIRPAGTRGSPGD